MTRTSPDPAAVERLRRSFPGRNLPPGYHADFIRLTEVEMRGLVDASIIASANRLTRFLEDEWLDDEEAIEAVIKEVLGFLGAVAHGWIAFAPNGTGLVYRVDSPGPTPEEEAGITQRFAGLRPMVLEALQGTSGCSRRGTRRVEVDSPPRRPEPGATPPCRDDHHPVDIHQPLD